MPKKSYALIKQNIGNIPSVNVTGSVAIKEENGPMTSDDSCEISNPHIVMNNSTDKTLFQQQPTKGFSQLVNQMPHQHRITVDSLFTQQKQESSTTQQSGKSSGSISPFHQKFRIQQRSQERENIFQ